MARWVILTSNMTEFALDGRIMLPFARCLGQDPVQNGTEMLLAPHDPLAWIKMGTWLQSPDVSFWAGQAA